MNNQNCTKCNKPHFLKDEDAGFIKEMELLCENCYNFLYKRKYLVRPHDFHIFELDPYNNAYRSYTTRNVTYLDGTRPHAQEHFKYELLTEYFGFFGIDESQIPEYEEKNNEYHNWILWYNRSDGHGGIKGGTMDEYLDSIKK